MAEIEYPAERAEAFIAAMVPMLSEGASKAAKVAAPYLAGISLHWPDYDRRLAELGVLPDSAADDMDDEEMDKVRFASDVGMSIAVAIHDYVLGNAYNEHRWAQIAGLADRRPFIRFKYNRAPIETLDCSELDRQIYRLGVDAVPMLPCWRPDCRCYIESLSQRDLDKLAS